MTESIGEKLRLAREARGIALRDISEQTRISMRYLEAIEVDDYRRLPGGIFNRSFIRAYAKFVGYDENQAIDDYSRTLRELGESDEESEPKTFKSLVYTDDASHNRSPLKNLLLAIVILAILTACVLGGLHFYRRRWAPKVQPGTAQPFAPGQPIANRLIHFTSLNHTGEGQHEFTA
jgi:cytoskeletal protein RodZ